MARPSSYLTFAAPGSPTSADSPVARARATRPLRPAQARTLDSAIPSPGSDHSPGPPAPRRQPSREGPRHPADPASQGANLGFGNRVTGVRPLDERGANGV